MASDDMEPFLCGDKEDILYALKRIKAELATARAEIERLVFERDDLKATVECQRALGLSLRQYFAAHCPPVPGFFPGSGGEDSYWKWRTYYADKMCSLFQDHSGESADMIKTTPGGASIAAEKKLCSSCGLPGAKSYHTGDYCDACAGKA